MIVEIKDLVKRYGDLLAVDHLDLDIKDGEIYGLLGPNGSGKTTVINCLLSLLKYEQGEISIFGKEMKADAYDIKSQIGVVMQNPAVYEELTVRENINYFSSLYISDNKKRKDAVDWAIDFVQLKEFEKYHPSKLSGGLLRRLNLACGIAHKPKLIILDEPTVAVDPQSRNRILEGIKDLRDNGSTVLYTTHYMEEVEAICDKISIMDKGKILVTGSSQEIKDLSQHGEVISITAYDLSEEMIEKIKKLKNLKQMDYKDALLTLRMNRGMNTLTQILDLFEEEHVAIQKISLKQPSLNDVFLEITGKELRDHV
ncbi:MAG: ABC transporter ATP-binding protein [Gallicola sp.]|nr:ABC transporter ATP-binding protein [Gallicola sp.]